MIKVMTWNLQDLFLHGAREDRLEPIGAVVRDVDPDILCVQEIRGHAPDRSLRRLADAVGLRCDAVPGWISEDDGQDPVIAAGVGDAGFHVGILWRPGITPVPGSWRHIGRAEGGFWHAAATITLDVGGPVPLTAVCTHWDPFRPNFRFEEAARTVSLAIGKTAVVCADFNGPSADRRADGMFYDPDPIAERGWHDAATFQVAWDDDPDAPPRVDRRAAERLRRAGLVDAACALDVPWQATSGHWQGDPHGPRRVDRILATSTAAPALRGYRVIDTEATRGLSDFSEQERPRLSVDPKTLSDHLPVVVELEETLLRAP